MELAALSVSSANFLRQVLAADWSTLCGSHISSDFSTPPDFGTTNEKWPDGQHQRSHNNKGDERKRG